MLPQDPVILLSVVNTRLRDGFSLEELCIQEGLGAEELCTRLGAVGFFYDAKVNQFK